ncbi:MAG TPA: hypothetical protein VL574_09700 [Stellaceae bacterium]|nr:hypothetical protein [Stellaceae bacterium]
MRSAFRSVLVPACLALGVLVTGLGAVTSPAEARGHVFVGVGLGGFGYAPWGPPVYYAPPPVYYVPPTAPAYYNPNTGTYDSGTTASSAPAFDTSNCQPYHSTAVLDGTRRPISGTACKQPDGTWRMMN